MAKYLQRERIPYGIEVYIDKSAAFGTHLSTEMQHKCIMLAVEK